MAKRKHQTTLEAMRSRRDGLIKAVKRLEGLGNQPLGTWLNGQVRYFRREIADLDNAILAMESYRANAPSEPARLLSTSSGVG